MRNGRVADYISINKWKTIEMVTDCFSIAVHASNFEISTPVGRVSATVLEQLSKQDF